MDLELCENCPHCQVVCSYFYHPQNNGITSLWEYATFATICRHCEQAPCVNSCYRNALERSSDGHLKRYNMRCTSCKSCTIACPFGIIFPEFIPYLDSKCDYCITKMEAIPSCVTSCPKNAVQIKEIQESLEENIYFVGEHLAVRTMRWSRQDIQPPKKR